MGLASLAQLSFSSSTSSYGFSRSILKRSQHHLYHSYPVLCNGIFLFEYVKITYVCSLLAKNEIPIQEEDRHEEPHDYKEMDDFECDDIHCKLQNSPDSPVVVSNEDQALEMALHLSRKKVLN